MFSARVDTGSMLLRASVDDFRHTAFSPSALNTAGTPLERRRKAAGIVGKQRKQQTDGGEGGRMHEDSSTTRELDASQ
jgi:hypothetical protein